MHVGVEGDEDLSPGGFQTGPHGGGLAGVLFKTQGAHRASGSIKAIWYNIRAVDLLETLPQVDKTHIGVIGHSLGGHNALFTAVFDDRLKAVVTSCGFTPFHDYYGGKVAGPVFSQVTAQTLRLLGVQPDLDVKSQIIANQKAVATEESF